MELIGSKKFINPVKSSKAGAAKRQFDRVDFETSTYYHNLDDVLIIALDKLLKRNNIDTTALNSFKILENTGKNSTSYKMAAAFIEGLKVGV